MIRYTHKFIVYSFQFIGIAAFLITKNYQLKTDFTRGEV